MDPTCSPPKSGLGQEYPRECDAALHHHTPNLEQNLERLDMFAMFILHRLSTSLRNLDVLLEFRHFLPYRRHGVQ